MNRKATHTRTTKETDITVELNLDGTGQSDIATGIGFFDHMLEQIAKHGALDLKVKAKGDTHIDDHHTIEDTAIVLGQALSKALGDKKGIYRYAHAYVPMDEALARVVIDLSGRAHCVFDTSFSSEKIGSFDTELVREFFEALSRSSQSTIHATCLYGHNAHHQAEALFKALAKALRGAIAIDSARKDFIPSTKGSFDG